MKKCIISFMAAFFILSFGAFAEEPVQTQPATDGKMEASVTKIKIRGDVLTFNITLKNISGNQLEPEVYYKDFYYTDFVEKKKYLPLKDANGLYIAGPQSSEYKGGVFKYRFAPDDMRLVWVKFPAPPQTTESIDFHFPGFMPFEDIEIER